MSAHPCRTLTSVPPVLFLALFLAACGGGGGGGGATGALPNAPRPLSPAQPDTPFIPMVDPHPALAAAYGACTGTISGRAVQGMARFVSAAGVAAADYGTQLHIVDGGNHGENMRRVANACLGDRDNHTYHEIATRDGQATTNLFAAPAIDGGVTTALTASDGQAGASVINVSISNVLGAADTSGDGASLKVNGDCRVLMTVPAGNDNAMSNPGQGYTDRDALDCAIIVAMAPEWMNSTPCGVAMNDCLIAPGGFPVESVDQSSCAGMTGCTVVVGGSSGASVATASVLAAAAQRWTTLTPETLRALAFRCADADRPPSQTGPTRRNGRGYLSMACLFNPSGRLVDPVTMTVVTGSATVAGLSSMTAVTGLDEYGRDFAVPAALPLNLAINQTPAGVRVSERLPIRAYAGAKRLGVALDGGAVRMDAEYIDPDSPLSPVRGTGAWTPGAVMALTAMTGGGRRLSESLTIRGHMSCRGEHMMARDGSLLTAYDAMHCAAHAGASVAIAAGVALTIDAAASTPRYGRVKLAGRSYTLDDGAASQVRLAVTAGW